jgi:hypothetical protein
LVERKLVLKSDLQTPLASEPLLNSEMAEAEPGSSEELIWNGVAGPDGWGTKILSYPKPVLLSDDKSPIDVNRYIPIVRHEIGGLFIDKESIEGSQDGVTALGVQAFHYDGELQMGGMVMQYASLPYVDAIYAVNTSDYSFSKKAMRQMRFTIFGPGNEVIYSVKIANPIWENADMNPMVIHTLMGISDNLPENLHSALSADVKDFSEYVRKKIEEMREMYPTEEQEQPEV